MFALNIAFGDCSASVPPYPINSRSSARNSFALGVAAEIVVVVQDQDANLAAVCLAVERCPCQPTDATPDHDHIETVLDPDLWGVE